MKTDEWIKAGRMRLGYSRERLAEAIGCSVQAIKAWEAGIRPPSEKYMDPLVSLLGVPTNLEYRRSKTGVYVIPETGKPLTLIDFDNSTLRRNAEA